MIENPHDKIRILIAESFDLIRIGLRSLFENHATVNLVADTGCIEDLFHLAVLHKPDVILIDLLLSNGNYAEHIAQLVHTCPQSKVLAFSQHNSADTHLQIFHSGASGVISKDHPCKFLLKAIHSIHAGQTVFARNITKLVQQAQFNLHSPAKIPAVPETGRQARLSDCERRVALLASKGLSAKEISLQLRVTEKTIRNQLSVIYKKTGVRKQIELCLIASEYNYFQ
jgi:DNA-binding NarL/FixJ family response regulator